MTANEEWYEPEDMARSLPVLPLPQYTLFPNTLVPFHVFEPRYRAMLDDCLSGRRLLVVAGLRDGWEARATSSAADFEEVAGLGRVVSDRRYTDGRVDLFVHCISRVRIVQAIQDEPYPLIDIEPLPDTPHPNAPTAFQRTLNLASRLAVTLGDDGASLAQLLGHRQDLGALVNRLCSVLVDSYPERRALLAERCPVTRAERLSERLAELLLNSTPDAGPGAPWVN